MSRVLLSSCVLIVCLALPAHGGALELGVGETGLALGDAPRWTGIRLNVIDSELEDVRGLNFTLWRPDDAVGGRVTGLGLGVWGPEAAELVGVHAGLARVDAKRRLAGVAVALGGVSAGRGGSWEHGGPGDLRGLMVGGLGVGAAGDVEGIVVGGLGIGTGGDLNGISVGGLGMGVGGSARGIVVGGLGAGIGEDLTGIGTALLGFGVGESISGIVVTGLGHGVGTDFTGLSVAGLGTGIGEDARGVILSGAGHGVSGDFTGISAAGLGMGVGGELSGIHVAGLGLGAEETRALTVALGTTRGEVMRGATISAYNRWDTEMRGLAIGLVNVTDELHGVQIGLLNIVRGRSGWNRVLPILNVGR